MLNLDAEQAAIMAIVKGGINYRANMCRIDTDAEFAKVIERVNRQLGQIRRHAIRRIRHQRHVLAGIDL